MDGKINQSSRESAAAAPGLRAALWIEARYFFSRSDAQNQCWLWLLGRDGRVQALRLDAARHGRDDVALELRRRFTVSPDLPIAAGAPNGPAWPLPVAPVVPLPRWAVSWGHPVQHAIRAFAAALDHQVLDVLGRLELPGPFFGSVENYNRLALLPEPLRSHRLQALADFPPLVAPLLLELHERPDLFGTDEDLPSQRLAWRQRSAHGVLEAIDRGRDLIGALAAHYRIDRALVRSPLCREPWPEGRVAPELLQLLQALPAHRRPRHRVEVAQRERLLRALPVRVRDARDVQRLVRMFGGGWSGTWQAMQGATPRALELALRDTRDFLRAVLEQVEAPASLMELDVETVGLAWLVRRGGVSLLQASQRWHERPLENVEIPADGPGIDRVEPLFGTWSSPLGSTRELTTRPELIAEGDRMRHCVGGYWDGCWLEGVRIVHIETAAGTSATAMYAPIEVAGDVRYVLEELRGPCNDEAGDELKQLAGQVGELINADERGPLRQEIAKQAAIAAERCQGRGTPPTTLRRLDLRSRREAQAVLAWCATQPDWSARANPLFRGAIAGLAHAEGARLVPRLDAGDPLQLVREPDNPYDQRAIRIEWNGRKLGYVPRAVNTEIARRMDAGYALAATILAVHRDRGHWDAVEIEVLPEA